MTHSVPYIQSPAKNACALACHLMVCQTFFPEMDLDNLKKILRWKEGMAVWAFPLWLLLLDKGIAVTDFDSIDYKVWVDEGFDGLEKSLSKDAFDFLKKVTFKPEDYTKDIQHLFVRPSFKYHLRSPTLDDLRDALSSGGVCEVVLDSCALNKVDGFSLHRVVVLDVTDTHVEFHDPANPDQEPRPNRKETIEQFMSAWPSEKGGIDSIELCVYKKKQ